MVQSQGRLSEDIKFDSDFTVNHWELYEHHHCKLHYKFYPLQFLQLETTFYKQGSRFLLPSTSICFWVLVAVFQRCKLPS